MDVLHLNGLIAADWVVIPTRPDALAVDGVKEILTTMAEIGRTGHRYRGYSILPTFFDRTTRETFLQFQDLARTFGEHVWPPIPQDTRVRETAAYGKTLVGVCPAFHINRRLFRRTPAPGGLPPGAWTHVGGVEWQSVNSNAKQYWIHPWLNY